ncbi:hypothetical protein [Kordiimonas sp.]|uniref:hypothetical protein n=1 Tax=Kordiimonas sp. TaxID=1970157 RepID=UPI003A91A45A
MTGKAKHLVLDDVFGRRVNVRYEDHDRDEIRSIRGVFESVTKVGVPEVLCVVVRTDDDPERRRYIPREDVLSVGVIVSR